MALIWYCHLMEPASFQDHLWSHGHRAFGLDYHHFPVARLLALKQSGKWSDKTTEKEFERWASSREVGYYLSYQLWPFAPWTQISAFTKLLRRNPKTQPPRRLSKASPRSSATPRSSPYQDAPGSVIYMPSAPASVCSLRPRTQEPAKTATQWPIATYALFRSGELHLPCQAQFDLGTKDIHSCELAPWPCISHLKSSLYRQAAFWNAVCVALDGHPDTFFTEGNRDAAMLDYEAFITLLRRPIPRVHGMSKFDPHAEGLRALNPDTKIVPPTLEVDLLWRTHRLYPGSYLSYCDARVGQLITSVPAGSAYLFAQEMTRAAWDAMARLPWPQHGSAIDDYSDSYTPSVAALAPAPEEDEPALETRLSGFMPRKERRDAARKSSEWTKKKRDRGVSGAYTIASATTGGGRSSTRGSGSTDRTYVPATVLVESGEGGYDLGKIENEKNWRISGVVW